MAGLNNEIESFVLKFRQLWSAGLDANLTIETHAGIAWVDLKLNLGQHGPNPVAEYPKRATPSRIRRRERRAGLFKQNENIDNEQTVNCIGATDNTKVDVVNNLENVTEKVPDADDDAIMDVVAAENDIVREEIKVKVDHTTENVVLTNANPSTQDTVAVCVNQMTDDVANKVTENAQIGETEVDDTVCLSNSRCSSDDRNPLAIVHATAVVENSPYMAFSNDEWGSLLRFIANKDHMKKNIADVKKMPSNI